MAQHLPGGRRLALSVVALAVLGGMAWVLIRNGLLAPIKVTVAQVVQGDVQPAIVGMGTVEARRSWMVGPTVASRVLSVAVDVGDAVQPGQLLAEMDSVDLEQRLQAADASWARARSVQLAAQAQLADAMARHHLADVNWRRNEELARQQFISPSALEGRQQELTSAGAVLQSAQANVSSAEQDVQRLGAERAALAQQRSNQRLRASAAAVVATREAEPGATVVAGQAVLRLVDPASLWVKTRIDQGRAAGLAVGQPAQVVLRSQPGRVHAASVARLELLADTVTEERLVQVAWATPPQGVSVGELAEVTIQLPRSSSGWVVPHAALQRQNGQSGVWRLGADGKPAWVAVKPVASGLDGAVRVDSPDLSENDRVVHHSQKPMHAGMRVQVVDALVPVK